VGERDQGKVLFFEKLGGGGWERRRGRERSEQGFLCHHNREMGRRTYWRRVRRDAKKRHGGNRTGKDPSSDSYGGEMFLQEQALKSRPVVLSEERLQGKRSGNQGASGSFLGESTPGTPRGNPPIV